MSGLPLSATLGSMLMGGGWGWGRPVGCPPNRAPGGDWSRWGSDDCNIEKKANLKKNSICKNFYYTFLSHENIFKETQIMCIYFEGSKTIKSHIYLERLYIALLVVVHSLVFYAF